MLRCLLCALLLALCLLPFPAAGAEIAPQLQAELAAPSGEPIPIILTFAEEPDLRPLKARPKKERRAGVVHALRQAAEASQKQARALLKGRGKKFEELWIANALALEASPALVLELASRPEVASVEFDGTVPLPVVEPSQLTIPGWNIDAVRAPDLWAQGFTGQGVVVAILDSGVDPGHPDVGGRWLGGPAGWFDPYRSTTAPYDPDGHGTMVTGVVLGGSSGGSAIGVAPGANWVAAKVFRDDGLAVNSQILKALQWVLDPDGDPATDDAVADIVNNSWGFEEIPGTCDTTFRSAVENLKAAGLAVVFSAGNAGPAATSGVSPANYPESFAVGAVDPHNIVADFSSRGPSACDGSIYPETVAPGVAIRTADLTPAGFPPQYVLVDGTSFSAPHVSGVMALLLSADPALTPAELETSLVQSATDLGPFGPDQAYGYGLVNARAAYDVLAGSAPMISVYEPSPPQDDLLLEFGNLPPGTVAERTVTIRNIGQGLLGISRIGSVLPPFEKVTDGCTGHFLGAGGSCSLSLRFSPKTLGRFTGELAIDSSDPDNPQLTLQLGGTGNTPPPAPLLLSPAQGAANVAVPVELQWRQGGDADGDTITHRYLISERSDFSNSVPMLVGFTRTVLLAGTGGMLLFGAAVGVRWRRWRLFAALIVSGLLLACGGGGGSDSPALPAGEVVTQTVSDLRPATTYYWKVIAEDSRGGTAESEVKSFTTRP